MNKRNPQSNLSRLDKLKDADIDYSEIPELGDRFFAQAKLLRAAKVARPAKVPVYLRLDEDVLAWLRKAGRGYQTRMNEILRTVMEKQPQKRPRGTHG
jgi:uncharacterized protein (DUF4415 family)